MKKRPDPLNHELLERKLVKCKDNSIPLILEELKSNKKSHFVEIAVKIFHEAGDNYSSELLDIIKNHQSVKRILDTAPKTLYIMLRLINFTRSTLG